MANTCCRNDDGNTMRGRMTKGCELYPGQEGGRTLWAEELAANDSRFRELMGRISE